MPSNKYRSTGASEGGNQEQALNIGPLCFPVLITGGICVRQIRKKKPQSGYKDVKTNHDRSHCHKWGGKTDSSQQTSAQSEKNVAAPSASFTWQDFTAIIVHASGSTESGDVEGLRGQEDGCIGGNNWWRLNESPETPQGVWSHAGVLRLPPPNPLHTHRLERKCPVGVGPGNLVFHHFTRRFESHLTETTLLSHVNLTTKTCKRF